MSFIIVIRFTIYLDSQILFQILSSKHSFSGISFSPKSKSRKRYLCQGRNIDNELSNVNSEGKRIGCMESVQDRFSNSNLIYGADSTSPVERIIN